MSLVTRNVLISLGITALIVSTVAYAINYLDRIRLEDLSAIESQLYIDTLSLDTQFSLLAAAPCENLDTSAGLSGELADLGARLAFTEERLGSGNKEVIRLKQQYTLLEIRDYLITRQLADSCGTDPVTVLYFYSNAGDCETCDRAGHALSYLHDAYPNLRVYSFDYHLELGALATLKSILKLDGTLPAFVISDKTHYNFTSLSDLQMQFPKGALSTLATTTSQKQ